jgi:divalent metal cation (Fe/Co/Zn/Cd) transporter
MITLIAAGSISLHRALIDAVKNPKLQENISNYIEEKFQVKVKDVLIRPLGHAFSTQVYVILDRNMPLSKAYETTTKIQNSIALILFLYGNIRVKMSLFVGILEF